jgi:hypothetical protein
MFTFVRDEVGASVPKIFFLASLSFFCLFLIIFFLFFFSSSSSSSSSSSFQKKQKALASQQRHTNEHTNGRTTPTKENHSIKSSSKIKNARRATLGRVLRRTRERARREAIERDRSSSGGEHREEQFRTRWVGQGSIELKFCFRTGKKSTLWHRDGSFFFLSLSLSLLKALRRARRLAEVLYLCIKLTSSFLF